MSRHYYQARSTYVVLGLLYACVAPCCIYCVRNVGCGVDINEGMMLSVYGRISP